MGSGCLWENKFKIYFKSFHLIFFLLATSAAAAYIRKDPFLSTFFPLFFHFFGKRLWRRLWLFRLLLLLPVFGTGKSEDWSSLSWLFFCFSSTFCVVVSFFRFFSSGPEANRRGGKSELVGGRTFFFWQSLSFAISNVTVLWWTATNDWCALAGEALLLRMCWNGARSGRGIRGGNSK